MGKAWDYSVPDSAKESPKAFIKFLEKSGIQLVNLKMTDFSGILHAKTYSSSYFRKNSFSGTFDISSIQGGREIFESDERTAPDLSTAVMDPFCDQPTVMLLCNMVGPDGTPHPLDPRYVASQTEQAVKASGIADVAYIGPEPEGFFLRSVTRKGNKIVIETPEGPPAVLDRNGKRLPLGEESLRHGVGLKRGYFPDRPIDRTMDARNEIILIAEGMGIEIECGHHEVARDGQFEIDVRYDSLRNMADKVVLLKYITKNVAERHGLMATYMPKIFFDDNGSGMHVHSSLWKNGRTLMAGKEYAGMSQLALHYFGGILQNSAALCLVTNPFPLSYDRLDPGFEAPVFAVFAKSNRSAMIRIPDYDPNNRSAKRGETRNPDPTANPYLTFSAIVLAGLWGIQNNTDPGKPVDQNVYDLPKSVQRKTPALPRSLTDVINAFRIAKGQDFFLNPAFSEEAQRVLVSRALSLEKEVEKSKFPLWTKFQQCFSA